jgi:cell wall-associated NlpC family hydrolase
MSAANSLFVVAGVLPAPASYFDNPRAAIKLRNEAMSWIGTPFRPYYQNDLEAGRAELEKLGIDIKCLDIKGPGGGIDCVGLLSEIFYRIEATPRWNFPRQSADYQSHQTGDKILNWMRGKDDDPQSKLLASLFTELAIPEIIKEREAETPRAFFKPGDILALRHGGLFHMPLIYDDDLHFISSIPRHGVTEGTVQDSSYSIHLVAAFRLKPDGRHEQHAAAAIE